MDVCADSVLRRRAFVLNRQPDPFAQLYDAETILGADPRLTTGANALGKGRDFVPQRVGLAEFDLLGLDNRVSAPRRRRLLAIKLDTAGLIIHRYIGVGLEEPNFALASRGD